MPPHRRIQPLCRWANIRRDFTRFQCVTTLDAQKAFAIKRKYPRAYHDAQKACAKTRKAGGSVGRVVSIGNQWFESIREKNCFYVDKTNFIKEWWENGDDITLITRPRRFGKTLNMSMLECFFSNKYADRGELFEGLSIWEEEKYRQLQGTYPVIFLTFADVKQTNYKDAIQKIKNIVAAL